MKNTTALLIALALGAPAFTTLAQDAAPAAPGAGHPPMQHRGPSGPGREGRGGPGMPLIGTLDANHDGVIDSTEVTSAPAALASLDKNGDGQLTRDEIMPSRPTGGGRGPGHRGQPGPATEGQPPALSAGTAASQNLPSRHAPPIVGALDADHDGVLSAAEIANAPAALASLDQNNDGTLTKDELRGPRSGGPKGGSGNRPEDCPALEDGTAPAQPTAKPASPERPNLLRARRAASQASQ